MSFDPPIFVNVRDRLAPLVQLVTWLEKAGHQRIVLIDNDSTYEPLREYLNNSPHRVAHLYANGGTRAVWDAALAPSNDWYVYTDPDIVPIEECPLDLVEHLKLWLDKRPDFPKAGPGLYLDDLPESFPHGEWEMGPQIRGASLGEGAYASLIDTTFALYRPGTRFTYEAIRMGFPYEARHVSPSWYGGELSEEDRFYLGRANKEPCLGSTWAATVS